MPPWDACVCDLEGWEFQSTRLRSCLKNNGYQRVGDLLSETKTQLLRMSNFGLTSLHELENFLRRFGLSIPSTEREIYSELRNWKVYWEPLPKLSLLGSTFMQWCETAKVTTYGQLARLSEAELREVLPPGLYGLSDIRATLEMKGLTIGMTFLW